MSREQEELKPKYVRYEDRMEFARELIRRPVPVAEPETKWGPSCNCEDIEQWHQHNLALDEQIAWTLNTQS